MTATAADSIINPIEHLPLRLHRSEVVAPAPTRSQSTVDWLPDFSGYTWIAYGASSLLVIAHFPSPLSPHQTRIGPIFRQSFHLSSATPIAAAAEDCIWVFSHDSATSKGSFCWSQNAVLVRHSNVCAIRWTGSGDGIVSGGTKVVLWKRSNRCWEMAWKFKADQPHSLVSATWSIEGPSAAAVHPGKQHIN